MKIEKWFYYHYKHNFEESVNNYAYEVLGVARHTETEEEFVVYRPLYTSKYYEGMDMSVRPFEMFVGAVTKEGKTFPRFLRIIDQETISKLTEIKKGMYGV